MSIFRNAGCVLLHMVFSTVKDVELFRVMIINHNCCIKLVPLVIFIYDARSHIHQIRENLHIRRRMKRDFQKKKVRKYFRSY